MSAISDYWPNRHADRLYDNQRDRSVFENYAQNLSVAAQKNRKFFLHYESWKLLYLGIARNSFLIFWVVFAENFLMRVSAKPSIINNAFDSILPRIVGVTVT